MELKMINTENLEAVLKLKLKREQMKHVAPNYISICQAYAMNNDKAVALPFAIYENNKVVGFILIGKGEDNVDPSLPKVVAKNYELWRLMIDKKYQNKGYGTKAILKALEMMKNDEFHLGKTDCCWLSYVKGNDAGKRLYNRLGFIENGETICDEIIAVYKF